MNIIDEFKTFIARGNVIDMAVGIIVGAAFTGIVNSLVGDVLTPVLGLLTGSLDFSRLFIALDGGSYVSLKAAQDAGAPLLTYGKFINAVIQFFIVSFVIFVLVRQINKLKKAEAAKPSLPSRQETLLEEIRDLLRSDRP